MVSVTTVQSFPLCSLLPIRSIESIFQLQKDFGVKKVILLTVLSMVLCQLEAKTIFVKAGHNGNGSSWSQAVGCLHQALNLAQAGDQVWVAAGRYYTTTNGDRNQSFHIPNHVQVYGGFAGTEARLFERNLNVNVTVLSGEIGNPNDQYDNAFTVVTIKNGSQQTVLNGLTIEKGCAVGGTNDTSDSRGAGLYLSGNPTIELCKFVANVAMEGAAIYNDGQNGSTSPIIKKCEFISNQAFMNGGAIINNGTAGVCNPQILNCLFEENKATYGSAILNRAEDNGTTAPIVRECMFRNNAATKRGSIYNEVSATGEIDMMDLGCIFENNTVRDGQDISNSVSTYDLSSLRH